MRIRPLVVVLGCVVTAGCATAPRPAVAPARANHAPQVKARCAPCRVAPGTTLTVTADATDADGEPLTYQWAAAAGTLAAPTAAESTFTAPAQPGAVPVAITVRDTRGGMASDTITITVIR